MTNVTKMYKGWQTVIPLEIRKKMDIAPDDVLEWETLEANKVVVTFRKKKSVNDIIGIAHSKEKTNAVELKKRAQTGNDKI